MKTTLLSFTLLLTAALSPLGAECRITRMEDSMGDRFVIENDLIRVEAFTLGGRINSMKLKSSGSEFLEPIVETLASRSVLLPPLLMSNLAGCADWFWGEPPPESTPYTAEVTASGPEQVVLELKGRSGRWLVTRRVSLQAGSKALRQEVEFAPGTESAVELSYWLHIVPNTKLFVAEDGASQLLLPAKTGGNTIRQRTTQALAKEGVQQVQTRRSNDFYELAEPWAAIISPATGELLSVQTTSEAFQPDGLFYHWQDGKTSTMEMIHGTRNLSPQQSVSYQITVEPFASEADFLKTYTSSTQP